MALSAAWDYDAPLAHTVVPPPEVKNKQHNTSALFRNKG
jgi:hypothetical protein